MNSEAFYDKTNVFTNRIAKTLAELKMICQEERIPFFASFAVANEKDKTTYKSEMVSAAVADRSLVDNQIAKHCNVLNGFQTVPELKPFEMDMGDEEDLLSLVRSHN